LAASAATAAELAQGPREYYWVPTPKVVHIAPEKQYLEDWALPEPPAESLLDKLRSLQPKEEKKPKRKKGKGKKAVLPLGVPESTKRLDKIISRFDPPVLSTTGFRSPVPIKTPDDSIAEAVAAAGISPAGDSMSMPVVSMTEPPIAMASMPVEEAHLVTTTPIAEDSQWCQQSAPEEQWRPEGAYNSACSDTAGQCDSEPQLITTGRRHILLQPGESVIIRGRRGGRRVVNRRARPGTVVAGAGAGVIIINNNNNNVK